MAKSRVDPIYKRRDWREVNTFWRSRNNLECQAPTCLCPHGRPIVDSEGPWRLECGHIVAKHMARQLGWSDAQINHLSNSRPEHSRCNRSAGTTYGNTVRDRALPVPITSRDW
jgi:hypothetical protein